MFEPIAFKNQSGINLDLLVHQIDRRIQKIAWIVNKKKRRKNKNKKGNSELDEIVDIAVQTGVELIQSQFRQVSLTCSELKLDLSGHTKACSIVGVNTQLKNVFLRIEDRNIEESITYSRQGFSISPQESKTVQNDVFTSLAPQIQSLKTTQRQKTQQSQQDPSQKKMHRIASFGSQDSLFQNSSKKRIEDSIDSKIFSEQNIHERTSSQIEYIQQHKLKLDLSPHSLEKKSKENDVSRSKSKNKTKNNKSRKTITTSAVKASANFLKSTKNFKEQKNVAKQQKVVSKVINSKKIVTQKTIKSNAVDAFAKTMTCNNKDSLQKPFRSTSFIPRVSKGQISTKNSIIITQTKNSDRGSARERNYQKVTIKFQTKSRMKELVKSISPKARKQGNDRTVRVNLLKRIQQKMTNNIA